MSASIACHKVVSTTLSETKKIEGTENKPFFFRTLTVRMEGDGELQITLYGESESAVSTDRGFVPGQLVEYSHPKTAYGLCRGQKCRVDRILQDDPSRMFVSGYSRPVDCRRFKPA